MKLDILAIGVHPDDVELSASGTILKHIALGKTVGILDLTLGELGTRGCATLRTQEATHAAKILGVSVREQLTMADGFFENKVLQKPWRPKAVYHYIQDNFMEPDFVIDITPFIDKKMESIMAYSSQFFDPNSKEPATPISSANFMEYVKAKSSVFGRAINCDYAEGFTVNRYIGVENLFDLR